MAKKGTGAGWIPNENAEVFLSQPRAIALLVCGFNQISARKLIAVTVLLKERKIFCCHIL
jgi:hypothetical protein